MTKAKLRRRKGSPSMTRARWARFACNVWAQGDDAAISALDWAPNHDGYLPLDDGTDDVVIGVDLGWKRDTTAIAPVGILDDEDREVDVSRFYEDADPDDVPDEIAGGSILVATIAPPTIIAPPGDGTMTPEKVIHDALRAVAERWPNARYAIDPNADGQTIAQWIERELCEGDADRVIEVSQQPSPMCDASMGLAAQVRAGAIKQPDDAGLNAHVLAAITKWHGERWRLVQPRPNPQTGKRKPIDAAIAVAMALRTLRAPTPDSPTPFVIVVG
jgi:hypothetical protein